MNNPIENTPPALPPFTNLSQESIELLDGLFESASPQQLREAIIEIYHTYLIHHHNTLPDDFDRVSLNLYHFIQCLKTLEERLEANKE
jgi:hypothetical protein